MAKTKTPKMHKIFVYGTLRPDAPESQTYEMYGMAMFSAGHFPFITKSSYYTIIGQVMEVDEPTLAMLDKYEGLERGLYTREKADCYSTLDNRREDVWVYVGGPVFHNQGRGTFKQIFSGNWEDR